MVRRPVQLPNIIRPSFWLQLLISLDHWKECFSKVYLYATHTKFNWFIDYSYVGPINGDPLYPQDLESWGFQFYSTCIVYKKSVRSSLGHATTGTVFRCDLYEQCNWVSLFYTYNLNHIECFLPSQAVMRIKINVISYIITTVPMYIHLNTELTFDCKE